ncbi:CAP domain-containing protein [Gilbertella persicaria]|uniref:CAP domain-containing protein n=1 Tax=Gilbertella persicaria TaxID=101096 RepID=UPI0022207477|nr:CAP domain-containing protein [Gilbertella persicaria]KAI8094878.1 CAP domain-containing protein [Gilbertella persicaria]
MLLSLFTLLLICIVQVNALSQKSIQGILRIHNKHRSKHHAPALKWDKSLAAYAQKWSNRCVFEHSHGDYGENLALGFNSWSDVIDAWYEEVKDYNYNQPGFSEKTGHFTQLVWKSTTKIGCGVRSCSDIGGKLWTCSYKGYGNIIGNHNFYFKKNVLKA